ncbi:MAG TPA: hypothetical protein VGU64_10550 [Terriglobales bacterium]|nr:hypothetical protein [Terriglobales bacterium]
MFVAKKPNKHAPIISEPSERIMIKSETNGRWSNQLLAAMPPAMLALLERHLSNIGLAQGAIVSTRVIRFNAFTFRRLA